MKAILLVGGLGARVKHILPNVPKPMADISGRPFLEYLLDYLIISGITEVIFSVHHLKEKIIDHFGDSYKGLKISYAVETELLGTGGAILNSLKYVGYDDKFIVMNGDSFQTIDFEKFYQESKDSNLALVLRQVEDTYRYGRVEVSGNKISSFREKGVSGKGLINAGCYLIDSKWFKSLNLPDMFSIEQDVIAKNAQEIHIDYFLADGYFVDIGTPEDYQRAQTEVLEQLQRINTCQ